MKHRRTGGAFAEQQGHAVGGVGTDVNSMRPT